MKTPLPTPTYDTPLWRQIFLGAPPLRYKTAEGKWTYEKPPTRYVTWVYTDKGRIPKYD